MFERTFGIELEMVANIPAYSLSRAADKVVVSQPNEFNSSTSFSKWQVGSDGSIKRGRYGRGHEIKSRILKNQEGLDEIQKVVQMIVKHSHRMRDHSLPLVDRSCGLHVHVGIVDFTPVQQARICWYFTHLYSVLGLLVAEHRIRRNYHCASLPNNLQIVEVEKIRTQGHLKHLTEAKWSHDIYSHARHFFALSSLAKYGTVEIRLKEATLNDLEVAAWTALMVALVQKAEQKITKTAAKKLVGFQGLMELVGWSGETTSKLGTYRKQLADIHAMNFVNRA